MNKETELKIWEQSKVRYERINFILENLVDGVGDQGNVKLGIPECGFCLGEEMDMFNGCGECPWGKEFKECGIELGNEWEKTSDLLEKALAQNTKTLSSISFKIARLKEETSL